MRRPHFEICTYDKASQVSILDKLEMQDRMLEEQKQAEARHQFLSQMLSTHAVANVAYTDQGKRPCDLDTRIDILEDITKWVYDIREGGQTFLWLTGDPGCGKSAVTASVAQTCKDGHILWAQFFINRNLGNTTNPTSYFPSIARQLADHSPDVARVIHDALKEKPSLMDDISQFQAGKLFVDALKVASSTDPSKPVVVIIDALDETDPSRLHFTAQIFSQALLDLPSNAKVFISSRTEDDIRRPFSETFRFNQVKHIHLDTSDDSSVRDVSTFLGRKIAEIVKRHDLDVLEWPGEDRFKRLCKQASGLFIWAVTTIKFVEVQVDMEGKECLDNVLDELNLNTNGMGDINTLYSMILRCSYRGQKDPWSFEKFRRIVGCVVVLQQPLCLNNIGSLLNLQNPTTTTPVDIVHFIRRLRTVLVAGTGAIGGKTVPRLHKSFFEYITSERADPVFRINMDMSHGEVLLQCLRQIASLTSRHATESSFSCTVRYAFAFWTSHLPLGMMSGVAIAGSLTIPQLEELLRYWSRGGSSPSVHLTFSSDKRHIILSSDLTSCLLDANSDAQICFPFPLTLKCHTNQVLSVAFSPDGQQIVSGSVDCTLRLSNVQSGEPTGLPFKGHTGFVASVAFSPDGLYIISGSADYTLRLWDAQSGQAIGSPFKGHKRAVLSVAFSPDGKHVASGSVDGTLRLWDVQSGLEIARSPAKGYAGWSLAFSPDGRRIVSGSHHSTLCLWDARSCKPIGSRFQGHRSSVCAVAFSPDGRAIVSGSYDLTLRMWDAETGCTIGDPFIGHTGAVFCVAFSPDGRQIISGSSDRTLRLWDAQNHECIDSPIRAHTDTVTSVAFSPTGKCIASAAYDSNICLWYNPSQAAEFFFGVHPNKLTCVAVSLDGKRIISSSTDDTVRIWDARTAHRIGFPLKDINLKGIIALAFSPDECRFATASLDGTIHLWDRESFKLLASYRKDHVHKMTPLAFSSDGTLLTSFSIDGTNYTWNAASGMPIETTQTSSISLVDDSNAIAFNMEQGWYHGEPDRAQLRWFPVDNADFGFWAYIDGKMIHRDKTGFMTVTDMNEALKTWNGVRRGSRSRRLFSNHPTVGVFPFR